MDFLLNEMLSSSALNHQTFQLLSHLYSEGIARFTEHFIPPKPIFLEFDSFLINGVIKNKIFLKSPLQKCSDLPTKSTRVQISVLSFYLIGCAVKKHLPHSWFLRFFSWFLSSENYLNNDYKFRKGASAFSQKYIGDILSLTSCRRKSRKNWQKLSVSVRLKLTWIFTESLIWHFGHILKHMSS